MHLPSAIASSSSEASSSDTWAPLLSALQSVRVALLVAELAPDESSARILRGTQQLAAMLGSAEDELIGLTLDELLRSGSFNLDRSDQKFNARQRRALSAAVKRGRQWQGTLSYHAAEGSPLVLRWSVDPVLRPGVAVTQFVATVQNLTTEAATTTRQRALEQAIGQLSDMVVLFELDGRVAYANDAYLDWAHASQSQVLGRPIWALPGAPQRRSDLRWARLMLSKGRGWQREYALQQPEAPTQRGFVFATASPIRDEENEVRQFVAIGRDVTERRRLEAIAEAQNFHDNLGVVFSGIRHELGNPVNSVKTALQVVLDNFNKAPKAKLLDYLQRMQDEIGRIEYLLRSLRSYSLHDRASPEDIDVRSFLSVFCRLAQPSFERRGLSVEVIVDDAVDSVWADPRALNQVLLNLFGNATTALEGRDNGRIELLASVQGDYGLLIVRDNGPGIPSKQLPHIFKPFYTTRTGGTGLGLAICRHLLSLMRGSIELKSSAQGTQARILLDRRSPQAGSGALSP
jgi:PAS domain S-box-containing protein